MVEPEDDEQQQSQQEGDRAQQPEMRACAPQAHETADSKQYHTAEKQPGPQQSRYSRFGDEDSLIAFRRQGGELVEELLTYWARRNTGLLIAEHPVHLVERVPRAFGSAAGAYGVLPFGPFDSTRIFAQQSPHLGLLRDGHADGLPVHRDKSGRLVGDVGL